MQGVRGELLPGSKHSEVAGDLQCGHQRGLLYRGAERLHRGRADGAVDLKISQLVDVPNVLVPAFLPLGIFP